MTSSRISRLRAWEWWTWERAARAIDRRLGIDARSLAAFRIAIGTLLLVDLVLRSRDLVAHYADDGVLPRAALVSEFARPEHFSVHLLSGEAWVQAALFLIAGAFAAALAGGYRTRAATVVSWLLLVSLHNRNPVILNGGDVLLRLLLFWAMFLPLAARWSVDAERTGRTRERVFGVATAALLIQVVVMYTANAAFKLSGELWRRGDAIYYVFSLDQFTVLLGDTLADYPQLLFAMDRVWLGMLVGSVLLILLTGHPRTGLALGFVSMHLGMLLTMRLGLFPLIGVAALLPFLPGSFWDAVLPRLSRAGLTARVREWPARLDAALPEVTVAGLPEGLVRWRKRAAPAVAAFFLVLVLLWNVQMAGVGVFPDPVEPAVHVTRVDQRWNMFAPEPLQTDGWYVVPGELEDGARIDALHLSAVTWDRPPDLATTYPNARWRKYLVNLWRPAYADHRPYLAEYLCRRWNGGHENDLVAVTLYFMEQRTQPGHGPEPIERVELLRHTCRAS